MTPREGGLGGGGVRGDGRGGPEARRGLSEAAYNGGGGKDS
jgi:hypothetical protein